MKTLHVLSALVLALLLAGCGADTQKKQKLELAVGQVQRILNAASREPMAAAALQSNMQMGGGVGTYLASSLPDKFSHPIDYGQPARAWSIVVKVTGDSNVVTVEGYGEDLKKPLFTQSAKIGPPPPGVR